MLTGELLFTAAFNLQVQTYMYLVFENSLSA